MEARVGSENSRAPDRLTEGILDSRNEEGGAITAGLGISIVIPTWNGLHLLQRHLPSVLQAAQVYSRTRAAPMEIIVVDDGSGDGTSRFVGRQFPEVTLVTKTKNTGFAAACNTGFQNCRYPLVSLLNNDVSVEKDYFVFKAEHFPDDRVFAVTAKVFEGDPPLFATGGKYGKFRRGFWSAYFNYDVETDRSEKPWITRCQLLSFYSVGGFSTYDRSKLMELGGFNELLSPFHWEDIDLSYRGWKMGWEIRFEPRSVAHHEISATIKAHYKDPDVEVVAQRNRLLFHWMNLHSLSYALTHVGMLLVLVLTRILVLDFGFYRSFAAALRRLPSALQHRRKGKKQSRRSDRELSKLLSEFYRAAPLQVYRSRREVERLHFQSPFRKGDRVEDGSNPNVREKP